MASTIVYSQSAQFLNCSNDIVKMHASDVTCEWLD